MQSKTSFDRFANTKIELGNFDGLFMTGALGLAYTFEDVLLIIVKRIVSTCKSRFTILI